MHILEVGLHLLSHFLILRGQRFFLVVRELNQKQRIDIGPLSLISLGDLVALLESDLDQSLVHGYFVLIAKDVDFGIEHHLLLDHLSVDDVLTMHLSPLIRMGSLRCGGDA